MPKITVLPHAVLCPEGAVIEDAPEGKTVLEHNTACGSTVILGIFIVSCNGWIGFVGNFQTTFCDERVV